MPPPDNEVAWALRTKLKRVAFAFAFKSLRGVHKKMCFAIKYIFSLLVLPVSEHETTDPQSQIKIELVHTKYNTERHF